MSFAVGGEQPPGAIQRNIMAETGERIGEASITARRMQRGIAGEHRQPEMSGQIDQ